MLKYWLNAVIGLWRMILVRSSSTKTQTTVSAPCKRWVTISGLHDHGRSLCCWSWEGDKEIAKWDESEFYEKEAEGVSKFRKGHGWCEGRGGCEITTSKMSLCSWCFVRHCAMFSTFFVFTLKQIFNSTKMRQVFWPMKYYKKSALEETFLLSSDTWIEMLR